METYQEIKNEEAFGLDSLWSSIGGFLGIFIGYSLLNLLSDGYDVMVYIWNVYSGSQNLAKVPSKEMF